LPPETILAICRITGVDAKLFYTGLLKTLKKMEIKIKSLPENSSRFNGNNEH